MADDLTGHDDGDLAGDTGAMLRFRDDPAHDEPAVTLDAFLALSLIHI